MAVLFKFFIHDIGTAGFPQDIEATVNEWLQKREDIYVISWDWQPMGSYAVMSIFYDTIKTPHTGTVGFVTKPHPGGAV